MAAIRLQVEIGVDRKLIVQLPDSVQPGSIEIVIQPLETTTSASHPARDAARAKLAAAGALVRQFMVAADAAPLTVTERLRLGTLAPDAPSSLDLIDQDRGAW